MENKLRSYLPELNWLIISAILAFVLTGLLFGWSSINNTVDLHLSDTYFVFPAWSILTPLLLLVIFILYFIKEKRKSFSRNAPGWILIISGVLLIISLAILTNQLSKGIGMMGFSTAADSGPRFIVNPIATLVVNLMLVLEFISLILVLYVVYRFAIQKKHQTIKQS